jgi:hypothetical protein
MLLKNLTPFDTLAFIGTDTQDREYHVLAMSVGYTLVRSGDAWQAQLIEDDPLPLCLADEHWAEPTHSSLARESDLVPYKPHCDVLVRGHSYAPGGRPAKAWTARLRMTQATRERLPEPEPPHPLNPVQRLTPSQCEEWTRALEKHRREQAALDARPPRVLLDKTLCMHGPSHYGRLPLRGWRRGSAQRAVAVALRWEHAFGGASRAVKTLAPSRGAATEEQVLMNEVCFSNPVGCGWVHKGWERALARAKQKRPARLPAPQITALRESVPSTPLKFSHPRGEQDARAMRDIAQRYGRAPAGFGPLGKAWAPRLAKAGTYDQAWLDERHPHLPNDFDFGFWNGAPQDQQIAFPDLSSECRLYTENLVPGGGPMAVELPPHRAYALMRFEDGLVLPNPMHVDLIELDTGDADNAPTLRLVWRTAVLKETAVRAMEARFEMNKDAPLFTLAPSPAYRAPDADDLVGQAGDGAWHG